MPTLIEMLTDDDPSTRIVAAEQLGLVGPAANAAVPALLAQATRDGSQHANTTAAAALKSIDLTAARLVMTHFIPRLQHPDVQQRRTACAVLGSLGPVAKPAVAALLAVTGDPDELVRRNALTSLASIGIPFGAHRGCADRRSSRPVEPRPPYRRRPIRVHDARAARSRRTAEGSSRRSSQGDRRVRPVAPWTSPGPTMSPIS